MQSGLRLALLKPAALAVNLSVRSPIITVVVLEFYFALFL
jgi:hypothetical protein